MVVDAISPEPPGVEHGRATVNGVSLHYVLAGPPGAAPVVLLHVFPQSWLCWRSVLPRLAETYRVLAVDLRGYGDSEKPEGEAGYDKGTMAADVRALVGHLGLDRPVVIGHDRGGRVTRRFALDYPEAIAGAAMLDILPAEWVYDNQTAAEAAGHYWHWIFQVVAGVPEMLIAGHEAEYLASFFLRSEGLLESMRADGSGGEYLRVFTQPGAVEAALNDYRATFHVDVPRYREERKAGRRIGVPVHLLWGAKGNCAGRPVLDIWRDVAVYVAGEEVAGCGHYLPEEVAGHLLRFARTCLGGR